MKCSLSIKINEGVKKREVRNYGAKAVVSLSSSTLSKNNFVSKATWPNESDLKNNLNSFEKVASYIFSNSSSINLKDASDLISVLDDNQANKLERGGVNLYKGVADTFFTYNEDKILSPTPNNKTSFIIDNKTGEPFENTSKRTFLKITDSDIDIFKNRVAEDFLNVVDEDYSQEANDTLEEGIEFLIISSLYRGFDVVIESNIPNKVIEKAYAKYKFIQDSGKDLKILSKGSFINNSFSSNSLENFIVDLDNNNIPNLNKAVDNSNSILNAFTSEEERTTLNKTKKTLNRSKLVVANRLINAFKKIIPNFKSEALSSSEIEAIYGSFFKNKKGFIIEGKVILNIDLFSSDTLFHEFGHYYIKWLKESNIDMFNKVMEHTKNTFDSEVSSYELYYNSTGLAFSSDDIIEEVFVDKLGMLAGETLDYIIKNEAEEMFSDTVDQFAQSFLAAITGDKNIVADDTLLNVNSSVKDIIDIAMKNIASLNTPFLENTNSNDIKAFKDFLITKASVKEVFNGLYNRRLIKRVNGTTHVLEDIYGNRYDNNGNLDKDYTIDIYPEDTLDNYRKNKKTINSITPFLNKFKGFADVMFSVSPQFDVEQKLLSEQEAVVLNQDGSKYVDKDSTEYNRVTKYLQDNFTDPKETEEFIIISVYYAYKKRRASIITEKYNLINKPIQKEEIDKEASEDAFELLENRNSQTYKDLYEEIAEVFEFKTSEGTYLHNLAELFFRTLNYSLKIDYSSAPKDRDLNYFKKQIRTALTVKTTEELVDYYNKNFFNYLVGQENTVEYKLFKEAFEFIKDKRGDSNETVANTQSFLEKLDKTTSEAFSTIKGPITIMPEVKLRSKRFKYAGTIDLIVLDKDGKAYIFDYKTKEDKPGHINKWKGNGFNRKMTGTMSSYPDNAMMKASIQTSMYKLILKDLGIETADSKVFYVANKIMSSLHTKDVLYERSRMRYQTTSIKIESLNDVTSELLVHFKNEGHDVDSFLREELSNPIVDTIKMAAGNQNIDISGELDDAARDIYNIATNNFKKADSSSEQQRINQLLADIRKTALKKKGLRVKIGAGTVVELEPDLTEEEAILAIKEILKEKRASSMMVASLKAVFNSLDRNKVISESSGVRRDLDKRLRAVLADTDPSTHEVSTVSSNLSYGPNYEGIVLVTSKITNETRIVIANHDEETSLFGTGRNNILGNYLKTSQYKLLSPTVQWAGTNHEMRALKAALFMIRQKQIDPNFKVNLVVATRPVTETAFEDMPKIYNVADLLDSAKLLLEQMKKAGEVLPKEMEDILKTPSLFNPKEYIADPKVALSEYLSMTTGDSMMIQDVYKGKGLVRKKALLNVLNNYDPNQDYSKLFNAVLEFQVNLERSLPTEAQKVNNDLWKLVDQVIMDLMGYNYTISPKNTNFYQNYLMTTSKMSNHIGRYFNRKIQSSNTEHRADFLQYRNEQKKQLNKLALSKGIDLESITSGALYRSSFKLIFDNLWATKNKDRQTAFILKDPVKDKDTLSKAEIEYLIYFNKTLNKYANEASFSKVVIPYGWTPIIRKSKLSRRSESTIIERARQRAKELGSFSSVRGHETGNTHRLEFSVESKFKPQLPKDGQEMQYSFARRRALGLKKNMQPMETADDLRPLHKIEDNLENMLDTFVLSSLDSIHYREISAFGRSMYYNIKRYESLSNTSYDHVIETLSLIQRRVINHQESDSNNIGIKAMNKFVTTAVIAGTVSQALLETFTNPMITTANYIGDKLFGTLFSGNRDFSLASYSKAFGLVNSNDKNTIAIIRNIDMLYGISNSDTRALKDMLSDLEGKSIFQSKNMMVVNKMMMEKWQKITMVAYMLEQGIFYAHSIDENGNLVYDESEDKRFEGKDGKLKYDAVKRELSKQINGLSGSPSVPYEDRKLNRAWTTYDSNRIKEIIVELYSSLDDTSKSLSMYFTWMSFASKMRSWMFPKISRYFASPVSASENESEATLKKVQKGDNPEDYTYEYVSEGSEGIAFTVWSMYKQLVEYKTEVAKKGTLTDFQKRNVSNLLGDIIGASMFMAATSGVFALMFDDDEEKGPLARLVQQRLDMATGDVFFPKSLIDMTTGNSSMFIGVSIAARAAKAALETAFIYPQAILDPDVGTSEIYQAHDRLFGASFGPYKSGQFFYEMYSEDDR